MTIHGVIFDLGSTLMHFRGDWAEELARRSVTLRDSLAGRGYALDDGFLTAYQRNVDLFFQRGQQDWVQYTAAHVLQVTLAELGQPALAPDASAALLQAALAPVEDLWQPLPDAHAVLAQLQASGYRLGLVSNAPDTAHTERLIERARLRAYFDPLVISAALGYRKPNPRIFRRVAEQWALPPAAIAVVGDMLGADVLGAQLAGMRSVWATMDADRAANAAHAGHIVPDATIGALSELPGVVAAW